MQLANLAMQPRDAITFVWTEMFEVQRIEGESEGKQKSFLDISLQLQNAHVGWYSVTVCFVVFVSWPRFSFFANEIQSHYLKRKKKPKQLSSAKRTTWQECRNYLLSLVSPSFHTKQPQNENRGHMT